MIDLFGIFFLISYELYLVVLHEVLEKENNKNNKQFTVNAIR